MKISVVSRWHEAAFIAPFFLSHYSFADEIIIMLDKSTTDNSAEIIGQYPNARFEYFDHGGVINDRLLAEMMSDLAGRLKSDWVIYADADEFVFPVNYSDAITVANIQHALALADGNLIETWFWWVYRHKTDIDLDPFKPAIWQRRHGGDYTIVPGCGNSFMKPCIVRPETQIQWGPGTHSYQPNPLIKVSGTKFAGVHWQMADIEMSVKRHAMSKERLSAENLTHGWGVKNFTEEMIRAFCKAHEDDPFVF